MAIAVFIKNLETGHYYQRSIWFSECRASDAEEARKFWEEVDGADPVLVGSNEEDGE